MRRPPCSVANFHAPSSRWARECQSERVSDQRCDVHHHRHHHQDPDWLDLVQGLHKLIGECVAVIDKFVEDNWGDKIGAYFEHGIESVKLVYRSMEADKLISTVERILHEITKLGALMRP